MANQKMNKYKKSYEHEFGEQQSQSQGSDRGNTSGGKPTLKSSGKALKVTIPKSNRLIKNKTEFEKDGQPIKTETNDMFSGVQGNRERYEF